MIKLLRNFFWSHVASLGYLGSLSQKGRPEIFSKWVIINLSNPLRHPELLVDPLLTKNLDTAGPWCEYGYSIVIFLAYQLTQSQSSKAQVTPNIVHNLPILDECQTQSAEGLALQCEKAHQENSNDIPQPMCTSSFQRPVSKDWDKPGKA